MIRYMKEFVAIVEFLKKYDKAKVSKGFLIMDKPSIVEMLDRNKYDTSDSKLKIWKAMNWIDAEERRVTKRIYDGKTGTYKPCIKLDIKVYETLKKHLK